MLLLNRYSFNNAFSQICKHPFILRFPFFLECPQKSWNCFPHFPWLEKYWKFLRPLLRILHQSHVPDLIEIISKFGFEERNADGERLLEFCDAVELIVVNTCFKRQKNNLATYVSGSTVNTIDYLLLRRCERQIRKKYQNHCWRRMCITASVTCWWCVINCVPRKKKRCSHQGWKYGSWERPM